MKEPWVISPSPFLFPKECLLGQVWVVFCLSDIRHAFRPSDLSLFNVLSQICRFAKGSGRPSLLFSCELLFQGKLLSSLGHLKLVANPVPPLLFLTACPVWVSAWCLSLVELNIVLCPGWPHPCASGWQARRASGKGAPGLRLRGHRLSPLDWPRGTLCSHPGREEDSRAGKALQRLASNKPTPGLPSQRSTAIFQIVAFSF